MFNKALSLLFVVLLLGCEEKEQALAIKLNATPVSGAMLESVMDCMKLNLCAVQTKTTEDKEYLVLEFPGGDSVNVKISVNTQEQIFVEVITSDLIMLIVDNKKTGLADSVQIYTSDAKVTKHEFGSLGWAGGQAYYNEAMGMAFVYSLLHRIEIIQQKIERAERRLTLQLFDT